MSSTIFSYLKNTNNKEISILQTSKIGNFFAIDQRCWDYICNNLGINEAISYLILARGSLKNQKSSLWSVNAIEKYTSISRMRAKKAIENLQNNHLISNIKTDRKKTILEYKSSL